MVFSYRDPASLKRYVPKSKARRLAPPGLIGFPLKGGLFGRLIQLFQNARRRHG
jgi:hypothetical protein